METNCASLLADLFRHSDFKARSLNLSFRFIDDVLSSNNPNPSFGDLIHRIYPKILEIKDTEDTIKSALYLEPHLAIDGKGKLSTKLYDKHDDFSFRFVNFPFICFHISSTSAYSFHMTTRTLCQSLL